MASAFAVLLFGGGLLAIAKAEEEQKDSEEWTTWGKVVEFMRSLGKRAAWIECEFGKFPAIAPDLSGWKRDLQYLLIAQGYHGIIPGLLLKRCKIGLSRNPEARIRQIASFEGSQPPCDIAILKTVYVADMKKVEGKLHKKFKSSSIKLKKSREWFDLWIWQIWLVGLWMRVYQIKN